MANCRRYIHSDDERFTYRHVQQAGEWASNPFDDGWNVTGDGIACVGRAGVKLARKRDGVNDGMSNGARKRAKAQKRAERIAYAQGRDFVAGLEVVRDKRVDNPVEIPSKTRVVGRPKPHGEQPYYVYVREPRTGTVKLRSYTGTK